jgi:hypothetical protein
MRGIKCTFIVVLAIVGLALGTSVGAASGKSANLSGKATGAHIRNVVIKGGAQSNGRIPARMTRLLKTAASNPYCPGATVSTTPPGTQSCVWDPNYTGQVTCLQTSNSATAVQICDASQIQTTANRNNTAVILQVIISQNPPSAQDGTQIVKLRQTALGTGSNTAGIAQYIKQSLGPGTPDDTEENELEPDAPTTTSITQGQESHQVIHLHQVSVSGNNNAPIFQFLRQRERAGNAGTIDQSQNTAVGRRQCVIDAGSDALDGVVVDPDANMCVLLNQKSVSGKQLATVIGDYNQFQRTHKAGAGTQTQGVPFVGGEDIGLVQDSGGISNVLTIQNERQTQRAVQADVFQNQNGPRKGEGSRQVGNGGDVWKGFQTSTQTQTKRPTPAEIGLAQAASGTQTNFLLYSALQTPPGTLNATQTAIQNGATTMNSCSTSPCEILIVCAAGQTCAQTCPEGTFFNSETQMCESSCDVECFTVGSVTTSTPLYVYKR